MKNIPNVRELLKPANIKMALPFIPVIFLFALILGYNNLLEEHTKVAQNLIECRSALVKMPTPEDRDRASRKKCSEQVLIESMQNKPSKLVDATKALNLAYGACLAQQGMAAEKLSVD